MPETPEERMARLRIQMKQRAKLFKKMADELGPRVLELVQQELIADAQAQFEQMSLPQRDLQAVMKMVWEQVGPDVDYTVEENTPEHLRVKVTRCMWADEMRKLDAPDVGYAFQCTWDNGFCQGLNPAIKFTRTKTLMQGDDCCNHTYDLKPES